MPGEGAGGGEELAGVPGEAELAREVATALCCLQQTHQKTGLGKTTYKDSEDV